MAHPAALEVAVERAHRHERGAAALGDRDPLGPSVVGIRDAHDIPAVLERLDELGDRLTRHAERTGEIGGPRIAGEQGDEHRGVGQPQVIEALGGERAPQVPGFEAREGQHEPGHGLYAPPMTVHPDRHTAPWLLTSNLSKMLPMHTGTVNNGRRARTRRVGRAASALAVAALCLSASVTAVVGTAAPTWAAGARSSLRVGSSTHTLTVDGVARTYIVYKPAGLHGAVPLVLMLHGGYGTSREAEHMYRWNTAANRGHFVVAYPDGLHRAWNAGGGCCGQPAKDDTNDVGFITDVVHTVESMTPIDTARVYVTGISNGGIMSYRLACETDLFAAIGPVAATELGGCPKTRPISVIAVHGTADPRVPYNGGMGTGAAHIDGPAIPALNATWRKIDDCATPKVTTKGVVKTSVATCPDGRGVELVSVTGAGHQWPGSVAKGPVITRLLGLTPPSTAMTATKAIWAFFEAHPKRG